MSLGKGMGSPPNKAANIILCGFMGTGKSTVGRLVAARLGWPFVDTDAVIEAREGKPIRQIFAEQGEPYFRALEVGLCREIATEWRGRVIATGGGIVIDPQNREALTRAGLVICLTAPADVLYERLRGETDRPLLAGSDPAARIAELLQARAAAYGALPHQIDTVRCTPAHVADAVLALWEGQNQ